MAKTARLNTDNSRVPGTLLATGLYLTALALLAQGIGRAVAMGGTGAPVWSLRWRFASTGFAFFEVIFPLIGLAVASLTAALLYRRGMLRFLGATQLVLAIAATLALGLFLLDATQLGASIPPDLQGKFALTVGHTSFNAGLACVLLILMSVATLRAAKLVASAKDSTRRPGALLIDHPERSAP